jgi:hypothetical protein
MIRRQIARKKECKEEVRRGEERGKEREDRM